MTSDHLTSPAERVQTEIAAHTAALAELTARWNRLANVRLLLAVVVVGVGIVWQQTREMWAAVATVAALVAFVACVVWHRRVGKRRAEARTRLTLAQERQARLSRAWNALPQRPGAAPDDHPYAGDIDIFGHASLVQLLDATETASGGETLRAWLLTSPPLEETLARQEAIRALVPAEEWRRELAVVGRLNARHAADPAPLIAWLREARPIAGWLRILAAISALGAVVGAIGDAAGLIDAPLWLPFVILNGALTFGRPSATGRINALAHHRRALSHYRRVLPAVEQAPTGAPQLQELHRRLMVSGVPASEALASLDRRLGFVIPPSTILWPLLQLAVAWDIQVAGGLSAWAARYGEHVADWVIVIGELEALASLGTLAADHPEWAWPEVAGSTDRLAGTALGHPLLPNETRVANDVEIGPAESLLLVTGSNMAGKSTLLRAVALNAVLARVGGPVCASALLVAPWDVWTSVRIRDSLESGVSLYMAELLRLRQIVEAARARPILYLLDEVLQGTNTAERRIAAQRILAKLLETGSVGAVSTHDLELLIGSPVEGAAIPVHVRDQVIDGPNGPEMVFDYRLRPGIAPTTNALRLLALVGLGDEGQWAIGNRE